jgi:predicted flap endonuclease-1-like 5' DNA nuclease
VLPLAAPEQTMANVKDIEGVGEALAAKLAEAGVKTVEGLLEVGGTKKGRAELAESTGISEKLILRFVNHADLFRLNGVGPQMAELLEAAGVDSVAELAQRNAANLTVKLAEVNEAKNLVNRVPSETEVTKWIAEAETLPKAVTH